MKSNIRNSAAIAVDLGGTWMRAACVGIDGAIKGPVICKPTGRERPSAEIIADLVRLVTEAVAASHGIDKSTLMGVALGVATVIDADGRLIGCANLPTLGGVSLAEEVAARLEMHRPVKLFNDAACFTFGEWLYGIGQGTRFFCGVTLGTGIGMRIVADGRILGGCRGMAGEIWKSPLGRESVEYYVSGAGVMRLFEAKTGRSLFGADIQVLAEKGNADALAVFTEFGFCLGRTLAWIINCFDPEGIVLGGSVAHAFALFEPSMREAMEQSCSYAVRAKVAASVLGDQAALIGAAMLFARFKPE